MNTDCNDQPFLFQELANQKIVVDFGGGYLSSDGGGVFLRELEMRSGLLRELSECFIDRRDQSLVEHSVQSLISQRVNGLVLGYEDLNDHDGLRRDPLHGLIAGKSDPLGQDRFLDRDKGKALAAHSTLNRLELGAQSVPLFAKLRDCKRDASDGTVEALAKIVPAIRKRFGRKGAHHRAGRR